MCKPTADEASASARAGMRVSGDRRACRPRDSPAAHSVSLPPPHYAAMDAAIPNRTPYWHCRHMTSVDPRTSIAQCGRQRQPTSSTHGKIGCDRWEREPGIDDDAWDDPAGSPTIAPIGRNHRRRRATATAGGRNRPARADLLCAADPDRASSHGMPSAECSAGTTTDQRAASSTRAPIAMRRLGAMPFGSITRSASRRSISSSGLVGPCRCGVEPQAQG
jgi:hypothetical protein